MQITNCDIQSVRENGAAPRSYVFTQEGVAMLSAVLRSDRAVQMSSAIVRTFVRMRALMAANKDMAARLETLERTEVAEGQDGLCPELYITRR